MALGTSCQSVSFFQKVRRITLPLAKQDYLSERTPFHDGQNGDTLASLGSRKVGKGPLPGPQSSVWRLIETRKARAAVSGRRVPSSDVRGNGPSPGPPAIVTPQPSQGHPWTTISYASLITPCASVSSPVNGDSNIPPSLGC